MFAGGVDVREALAIALMTVAAAQTVPLPPKMTMPSTDGESARKSASSVEPLKKSLPSPRSKVSKEAKSPAKCHGRGAPK